MFSAKWKCWQRAPPLPPSWPRKRCVYATLSSDSIRRLCIEERPCMLKVLRNVVATLKLRARATEARVHGTVPYTPAGTNAGRATVVGNMGVGPGDFLTLALSKSGCTHCCDYSPRSEVLKVGYIQTFATDNEESQTWATRKSGSPLESRPTCGNVKDSRSRKKICSGAAFGRA